MLDLQNSQDEASLILEPPQAPPPLYVSTRVAPAHVSGVMVANGKENLPEQILSLFYPAGALPSCSDMSSPNYSDSSCTSVLTFGILQEMLQERGHSQKQASQAVKQAMKQAFQYSGGSKSDTRIWVLLDQPRPQEGGGIRWFRMC